MPQSPIAYSLSKDANIIMSTGTIRYAKFEFGVQIWHGYTNNTKQNAPAKDLGVTCVRVDCSWRRIEGTHGTYNWGKTGELITLLKANGFEIVYMLGPWLPTWTTPADAPPHFAEYCEEVINRWHPKYIETWSEPYPTWPGTVDELIALYQAGYNKIKELDPSITVIATWGNSQPFDTGRLKDYVNKGLADVCDAYGIHPYIPDSLGGKSSVEEYSTWAWNQYWNALNSLGITTKPIYITEFGYKSTTLGETEAANRLRQQLEWFEAHPELPIKQIHYFCLWDDKLEYTLVKDNALTPRQIYYAYKQFIAYATGG